MPTPVLSDRGTKSTAAPPPPPRRFRAIDDVMRVDPLTRETYSKVRCEQCRLGDKESEFNLCDACDKGFHIYCLRPIVVRVPTGAWFCPGISRFSPTPTSSGSSRHNHSHPAAPPPLRAATSSSTRRPCASAPPAAASGSQEGKER